MNKTYPLAEEIFSSIQGEGAHMGCPTTFIRMAGCNLSCNFCDTDHSFYKRQGLKGILRECKKFGNEWVCITGGEPLLQDLQPLVKQLVEGDFHVQIETNGTLKPKSPIIRDYIYISLSPKPTTPYSAIVTADEVKLLVDVGWDMISWYNSFVCVLPPGIEVFLQPVNHKNRICREALKTCLWHLERHPTWRLSPQLHKLIGVK